MKKALLVLLLVGFVGVAFVLADEAPKLAINGGVGTSAIVTGTSSAVTLGFGQTPHTADHNDWANANFSFSAADWGVTLNLFDYDIAASATTITVDTAMGWFSALNNMLKVEIGDFAKTDAHGYVWWSGVQWEPVNMLAVTVTPVAGAFLFDEVYGIPANASAVSLSAFNKDIIGLGYDNDMFGVHAVYDFGASSVMASAQFIGLKNLWIAFDATYNTASGATNPFWFIGDVTYDLGVAKPGLYADGNIGGTIAIVPNVTVPVGPVTLYSEFQYNTDNSWDGVIHADFSVSKASLEVGADYYSTNTWHAWLKINYSWSL